MNTIRVVIAAMPRIVAEILSEVINSQPDMRVMEELAWEKLRSGAAEEAGDVVVIMAQDPESRQACTDLLCRNPGLRVVWLTDDLRDGGVCELRPHEKLFESASLDELLNAIRAPRAFPPRGPGAGRVTTDPSGRDGDA